MKPRTKIACIVLLNLVPKATYAQCADYGGVARWVATADTPGSAARCAATADRLFVADGFGGVQIFDLSEGSRPNRVGSYLTLGKARDVAAVGHFVYAVDEFAGLQIIDVSDPRAPTLAGSFPRSNLAGVVVNGAYAYLTQTTGEVLVVDVSAPASAHLVGEVDTQLNLSRIAVAGPRAYATSLYNGLVVLDVSQPSMPRVASTLPFQTCVDVAASGSIAYVAASTDGLVLYDCTDPASPVRLGTARLALYADGVALIGNRAYVAEGYEIHIVDIANPRSPTVVAGIGLPEFSGGITAGVDEIFVATREAGVQVVSGGSLPPVRLAFAPIPSISHLALFGPYAVTAATIGGLDVVRLENPLDPTVLGHTNEILFCSELAVDEGFAFIAGYVDGFRVVDVSSPALPRVVATRRQLGGVRDLALVPPHVFVAADSGLGVYDVSTPNLPELVAMIELRQARTVGIVDHHAYVGFGSNQLAVIDISNPTAPVRVNTVAHEFDSGELVASGTEAYAPSQNGAALCVIDVSDPVRPAVLSTIPVPRGLAGLHLAGSALYAAIGYGGLLVIDITHPRAPTLLSTIDTEGYSDDVAASGEYVYVAESGRGLGVYPAHCGQNTPIEIADLEALPSPRGIAIRWHAARDLASSFEIQRAAGEAVFEAGSFESLGTARRASEPDVWEFFDAQVEPAATYTYVVLRRDAAGVTDVAGTVVATMGKASFVLHPPEPNPAHAGTVLHFDLARSGRVQLDVYDVAGHRVRSLLEAAQRAAGRNVATWDGRDASGRRVANGVYVVRLQAGEHRSSQRLVVLR